MYEALYRDICKALGCPFGKALEAVKELLDKLHRRNMQISKLKSELLEKTGLSWITISDLFFNSEEANNIEFGEEGINSDETKQNIAYAVKEWCSMYPEIGNYIDHSKLIKDYMNRV